jgi:phytanoyl-CoA hydroxylase
MIQSALRALNPEERDAFDADGFHIARGLFSPDEVETLRSTFMDVVKDGPAEGMSDVQRITDKTDPLYQYGRLMHPHINAKDEAIRDLSMRYMLDNRLGDILTDLFGENPSPRRACSTSSRPAPGDRTFTRTTSTCASSPARAWRRGLRWTMPTDNGGMVVVPGSPQA